MGTWQSESQGGRKGERGYMEIPVAGFLCLVPSSLSVIRLEHNGYGKNDVLFIVVAPMKQDVGIMYPLLPVPGTPL